MPTPIVLGQVVNLPDVLTDNHFNMLVGSVPGGGDATAFTIQNMTGQLPWMKNDPVNVELHRHKVKYAGKREYRHQFSATFVDSIEHPVIDLLRGWQGATNEENTNLPVTKDHYVTDVSVEVYGADNSIVDSRVFRNVWISDIEDITLNGAGNEPIEFKVTFVYDMWQYADAAAA